MNLKQASDVMIRTHIAALNMGARPNAVEIKSGPGVGKSSTVRQVCAAIARGMNEPVGLVTEMLATIQSVDIRGFMLPQKGANGTLETVFSTPPWYPGARNVTVFMPDGTVFEKGLYTGPVPRIGICFLDEWGQAQDDSKAAAAELLLNGEVGNTRLPMGWRVIAASNRLSDRAGVIRPLTFITNRRMELSIDAHLGTWEDWAASLPENLRPHHLTLSFAHGEPGLVFKDAVPAGDAPFCTPRTLVLMDRDLRALRSDEDIELGRLPMDNIAREVCSGWIGGGESAQYFMHIKFSDELPRIEDIEADPMKAKLPPKRDAQMVCAFKIAHHVGKTNVDQILKYMERLNIEMQILAVKTITANQERAGYAQNTARFTNWLLKNKDVFIASRT
jgi:hypothetical protein